MDSAHQPGCRANGLYAAHYVAVADLDPRVADALLVTLREAGIAAYVAPCPGSRGGYLEVRLPSRPTDRLWVDVGREQPARTIVAAEAGQASRVVDEDVEWAQIVAGLSQPSPVGQRPWPAAEDVPAAPFRSWTPADEPADEQHYVPPAPPPLPRPHPVTVLAWLALLAGALLLVVPAALGAPFGGGLLLLALGGLLGGFATLVWRMRDPHPEEDTSDDDGAVV